MFMYNTYVETHAKFYDINVKMYIFVHLLCYSVLAHRWRPKNSVSGCSLG